MKFVADLHIHSKYSRATSSQMEVVSLAKWAKVKGVRVLGTGDFTHPLWIKELREKLEPAEVGFFKLKETSDDVRFVLTGEISCIYSKNGAVRRIHLVVLMPSFESAEKLNAYLNIVGNIHSDGRPILGLDAKELTRVILETDDRAVVIPAHIWTPWFSLFGSKSGFNSLEECFEEYSNRIFAVETGLSSDPAMNWRLSALDRLALISNSDSHSPSRIAREANVFDADFSYQGIVNALKEKDPQKFLYTIEFFPEEGKYHYDGHRLCNLSFTPSQTKENKGICPKCHRPLVIGVMNRVDELADRPEGFRPERLIPYKSLIPLEEVIADAVNQTVASKKVEEEYRKLISGFGSELKVLEEASLDELAGVTLLSVAQAVVNSREGKVEIVPGYDGLYGKIKVLKTATSEPPKQKTLF